MLKNLFKVLNLLWSIFSNLEENHALMYYLRLSVFYALLGIVFFVSCKKDKAISPESCSLHQVSFSLEVQPIINANCAISGCHGTSPNAPFTMLNYGQIDTAVRFYNLLRAIKHEGPNPMPRISAFSAAATKLPDSSIRKISCWIEQGHLNN
jgi:hypothetical protein